MQDTGNDTSRQWVDDHPGLKEKIAMLVVEDKPTTATEMSRRDRDKMLAEEHRLYVEKKKYLQERAEYDARHADRPCYNGLDQYTTSQLKAELQRRKGKKPIDR